MADRQSPFPPIADYAFLADGEVNALIAPSGNVEWMCLPRPDAPSVFGAILDRAAGGFRVGPADTVVSVVAFPLAALTLLRQLGIPGDVERVLESAKTQGGDT